jgi:hypothetical protein
LSSCMRDWWQYQTSFEVIWYLSSALIAAWLSDRIMIWSNSHYIASNYRIKNEQWI